MKFDWNFQGSMKFEQGPLVCTGMMREIAAITTTTDMLPEKRSHEDL
jgi:hypothetical protein